MNLTALLQQYTRWYHILYPTTDTIVVYNPSGQDPLARVPFLSNTNVDEAITKASQSTWAKRSVEDRSSLLQQVGATILEKCEDLATIISLENGKPLEQSRAEVRYASSFFTWFAEEIHKLQATDILSPHPHIRITKKYAPVGVCACITPWNFPLAMLAKKIAPALASGCSIVCKPSEITPLSALALGYILQEKGIPANTVQFVLGNPSEIGKQFCSHPQIQKLSFTGSTTIGAILYAQSAQNLQKLSLELGGNAPFIVFASADIEKAIQGTLFTKFRNSGQACISSNRFIIEESIMTKFTVRLLEAITMVQVGDAFDPQSDIGPVINPQAKQKIFRLVQDAIDKGATLLYGSPTPPDDLFIYPIVLSNITSTMDCWKEEIFGPVITIAGCTSEEEAIHMANDTKYGLGAYVYSEDTSQLERCIDSIECGLLGINTGAISMAAAPFGGIKHSGFGKEGGSEGLLEYCTLKSIVTLIPS